MLDLGVPRPKRPSRERSSQRAREERVAKVEEARRQAVQQSPNVSCKAPVPPRKDQLNVLRERKRLIQQEVRNKQFQIKKLEESRSRPTERLVKRDNEHEEDFKMFRVTRLVKALLRLRLAFTRTQFRQLQKALFRIAHEQELIVTKQKQKQGRKLLHVLFLGWVEVWREGQTLRKQAQKEREETLLLKKMKTAIQFNQFMLLRKCYCWLQKAAEKNRQRKTEKLFEGGSEGGRVRKMVEQLKEQRKKEEELELLRKNIALLEEAMLPVVQEDAENSQNVSQLGNQVVLASKTRPPENIVAGSPKKPLTQAELAKRTELLEERNKKRKAALEAKKAEREERRLELERAKEEEQRRYLEQEKQRKLDQLKKYEARKRLQEEKKRRKEEEEKLESQKLMYAAAYHQRSVLKFSGFLLWKRALRVIAEQRNQLVEEHVRMRLGRAWMKFNDGLEVQRREEQALYGRRCVLADSFRKRKAKACLLSFLKGVVKDSRRQSARANDLFQLRLVRKSLRGWRTTTPELAHENLLWEIEQMKKVAGLEFRRLGRRALQGLKAHRQEQQRDRHTEKHKEEFKKKVSAWLEELPLPDIEQYL